MNLIGASVCLVARYTLPVVASASVPIKPALRKERRNIIKAMSLMDDRSGQCTPSVIARGGDEYDGKSENDVCSSARAGKGHRFKASSAKQSRCRSGACCIKAFSDGKDGTHADFLASPESCATAQFFLNDLYNSDDLTQRDANLARIVPMIERVLPAAALRTISDAVALDALSEKLDGKMAEQLGENFTEAHYIACYRNQTSRADRERQLGYIESVDSALGELVRKPLVGSTLAMMHGPAKLVNLSELQNFLERGFKAFKKMKHPEAFAATVVCRERATITHLYEGDDQPFSPDRFPC
jgi:hypothetical protein